MQIKWWECFQHKEEFSWLLLSLGEARPLGCLQIGVILDIPLPTWPQHNFQRVWEPQSVSHLLAWSISDGTGKGNV